MPFSSASKGKALAFRDFAQSFKVSLPAVTCKNGCGTCLFTWMPLIKQHKPLWSSSVQPLLSSSVSWDASSLFLPGHVAALWVAASGWHCTKSTEFLPHSSLPSHQTSCANKAKLHLMTPWNQVTSEIGVRHNPKLFTVVILPTCFYVSHPEALQHLLALYSQGIKVYTVVFLCCYTVQLELWRHSYYFTR